MNSDLELFLCATEKGVEIWSPRGARYNHSFELPVCRFTVTGGLVVVAEKNKPAVQVWNWRHSQQIFR